LAAVGAAGRLSPYGTGGEESKQLFRGVFFGRKLVNTTGRLLAALLVL
jgi:hypothetical protein